MHCLISICIIYEPWKNLYQDVVYVLFEILVFPDNEIREAKTQVVTHISVYSLGFPRTFSFQLTIFHVIAITTKSVVV